MSWILCEDGIGELCPTKKPTAVWAPGASFHRDEKHTPIDQNNQARSIFWRVLI
jgi:hypothetical protein